MQRTECSGVISKQSSSFFSSQKHQELFSHIYCVELLEVKLTNTSDPPHLLSPPGVLQKFINYSVGFPSPVLVPRIVTEVVILYVHLSLQFGGLQFALRPHFSDRSNKNCRLFSLLSFFLLVWKEWRPKAPYSLEARPQSGSPLNYFLKTTKTFTLGKNQIPVAFRHTFNKSVKNSQNLGDKR